MQFFETVYLCFMGTAVLAAEVLFVLSLTAQKRIKKAGFRFGREDTFNDLPHTSRIRNSSKQSISALWGQQFLPQGSCLFFLWQLKRE